MLEKIQIIQNFKYSFTAFMTLALAVIINLLFVFSLNTIFYILAALFTLIIILKIKIYNVKIFVISFIFFAIGLCCSYIHNNYFKVTPLPNFIDKEYAWVKGTINNIKLRGKYVTININNLEIYNELLYNSTPKQMLVNTYSSRVENAKIGDEFVAKVMLEKPNNALFKDDFDYEKYLLQNNINLLGQVRGAIYITEPEHGYSLIQKLKNYRLNVIYKINNSNYKNSNIANALITGTRGYIDETIKEDFKNSGLAHLMAISGMHMAFLAIIVFALVRYSICNIPLIALNYDSKEVASLITVFVSFGYLVLAGFNLPTLRAFIMVLLFAITLMLNRNKIALHTLFMCAIFILIINPSAIFSASFQLSFSAVLAMLMYNALHDKEIVLDHSKIAKTYRAFINTLNISIIAFCATLFVVASHFSYISVYSILANVVASFLMAFIVMPCLFIYYIGYILLNINLFASLNNFSLELLVNLANYFAKFNNSSVYVSANYSWFILFASILIICLFIFNVSKKYLLTLAILFVVFIIPIKFNLKPSILPINQQAIVLIKNNNYMLLGNLSKRDENKIAEFYKISKTEFNLPKTCDISGCIYDFNNKKILQINEGFNASTEDLRLVDYYYNN